MKILVISPNPSFGGGSTANRNIASMLSMAGHEVCYADEFGPSGNFAGVEYVKLPVYASRLRGKRMIMKHIRQEGFELVLFAVPQMIAFYIFNVLWLRLVHKVKFGIVFHSLSLSKSFKARIFDSIIAFASMFADLLCYVSDYTKVTWEKYLTVRLSRARTHVIHNAVPATETQGNLSEGKPRIALVGRLSEEKRPEIFCECAKKLHDHFDFNVWGNGHMEQELKEKYAGYVTFRGYESSAERIYGQTDILMVTSLFENCPMVILEARSYGIPALSVNVGGISEILSEGINGLFFDKDDSPEDIKARIERIVSEYPTFQKQCRQTELTLNTVYPKWHKAVNDI